MVASHARASTAPSTTDKPEAPAPLAVHAGIALAYAVVGAVALLLTATPGYASPLFPPAGIALAAALVYGRRALPAVALGSLGVQGWLFLQRGHGTANELTALALALAIALGAALQAGFGAWLVRRTVQWPLTLDRPMAVTRLFALGGALACTLNASSSSAALWLTGAVPAGQIATTWWTWWGGDTLGTIIATPVVLTLIGRPREAWRSRRLTVALPLALAMLLLGGAIVQVARWQEQRSEARFERDASHVSRNLELRLNAHLDALEGMRGVYIASQEVDAEQFARASAPWLRKLPGVQAIGWLYAAQAVGAVLAALLLGRLGRVRRRGVVAYLAVVVQGGAILLLGAAHGLPLAVLALFLSGASITVFGVIWEATLQERVPNEALGRVASVDMLGSIALLPVGLLLVGRGVTALGVTPSILICGGVAVVLAALALTTRAVRELD